MPLIAGISYELIKLSAKEKVRGWMAPIVYPGLWLQRLTTREPDRDQCEVALRALAACLEPDELAARTPAMARPSATAGSRATASQAMDRSTRATASEPVSTACDCSASLASTTGHLRSIQIW